jgi:hypothetical protein
LLIIQKHRSRPFGASLRIDVYVRGKNREVILLMTVILRINEEVGEKYEMKSAYGKH